MILPAALHSRMPWLVPGGHKKGHSLNQGHCAFNATSGWLAPYRPQSGRTRERHTEGTLAAGRGIDRHRVAARPSVPGSETVPASGRVVVRALVGRWPLFSVFQLAAV